MEVFGNREVNGVADWQLDCPSSVRPSLGYLGGNFSQKDSPLALEGPWAATISDHCTTARVHE
jgi:hypothetical protein